MPGTTMNISRLCYRCLVLLPVVVSYWPSVKFRQLLIEVDLYRNTSLFTISKTRKHLKVMFTVKQLYHLGPIGCVAGVY